MNSLFGLIGLGFGIYCLYAFYMLKFKKEINQTIMLPKEARTRKCKDFDSYCKGVGTPLLFLGIVVTVYGATDLYSASKGEISPVFWGLFFLVWVALFWFMAAVRKNNKKYFDV